MSSRPDGFGTLERALAGTVALLPAGFASLLAISRVASTGEKGWTLESTLHLLEMTGQR